MKNAENWFASFLRRSALEVEQQQRRPRSVIIPSDPDQSVSLRVGESIEIEHVSWLEKGRSRSITDD